MKSARKIIFVKVFLCFALIIYSCSSPTWEPKPITHPFLLGSDSCSPPCWMGIIPGKTSFDKACEIIEKLPFENEEVYYQVREEYHFIEWNSGDGEFAKIYYFNNIVEFINLRIEGIDLGSIILHYGDPDGYLYYPDDDAYSIVIFYPHLGLVFTARQGLSPIAEDMMSRTVFFLYPMNPEDFYSSFFENQKILNPRTIERPYLDWEGFGVYPSEISE
jgi:hypothetical protein